MLDDLITIGVSLPGGLRPPAGEGVPASTPAAFGRIKQSRRALCTLLRGLAAQPYWDEGLVWDTCQRVEFYGWLRSPALRAEATAFVRDALFGQPAIGLEVYRLRGRRAWHHLLRTACGLNSRLPGDLDVGAQLETAVHLARAAGAAGERTALLLAQVRAAAHEVGDSTDWGRFRIGYCRAALSQLEPPAYAAWRERSHVVIGGSTTSRSILETLVSVYRVPQRQITLVYRGYHGDWKQLRTALGAGRRLHVHDYTAPAVAAAVAAGDVVFFGLNVVGPVLELAALAGLRDFEARPLTVIDFNTLGSVGSPTTPGVTLWDANRLDTAVTAYARALEPCPAFAAAAVAADRWLRRRATTLQPDAKALAASA